MTYPEINTAIHFWQWVDQSFLDGIFGVENSKESRFVLNDNLVLGSITLRQMRVKDNSCMYVTFLSSLDRFLTMYLQLRSGTCAVL